MRKKPTSRFTFGSIGINHTHFRDFDWFNDYNTFISFRGFNTSEYIPHQKPIIKINKKPKRWQKIKKNRKN